MNICLPKAQVKAQTVWTAVNRKPYRPIILHRRQLWCILNFQISQPISYNPPPHSFKMPADIHHNWISWVHFETSLTDEFAPLSISAAPPKNQGHMVSANIQFHGYALRNRHRCNCLFPIIWRPIPQIGAEIIRRHWISWVLASDDTDRITNWSQKRRTLPNLNPESVLPNISHYY